MHVMFVFDIKYIEINFKYFHLYSQINWKNSKSGKWSLFNYYVMKKGQWFLIIVQLILNKNKAHTKSRPTCKWL